MFVDIQSEGLCFTNSNEERECDLYVDSNVPPLSYEIIKITYNKRYDQ